MSNPHIYSAGAAITEEIMDRLALRLHFIHDFEVQTATTFDNQRIIIPFDCTLKQIHAEFKTAPTGANAIFNVAKNGVDLWSGGDRPTLTAGQTTLAKTDCDEDLEEGDYLDWVDVQPGSTVAGGYGVITLVFG